MLHLQCILWFGTKHCLSDSLSPVTQDSLLSEQLLSFILLPLSTHHSRYEWWYYLWPLELPFLELLVVALLWTCALVHSRADSGEHSALWAAGRAARSWLHSPQRPHHGGDQVSPSGWGSACKTSFPCVFFFVGCVLARHLSDITLGACCWDYLNCLLWRRLVYCVKRLPTYVKLAVGLYSFETVCSENCNIAQSLPAGDISVQSLASCCTSQRCPAVNSVCPSGISPGIADTICQPSGYWGQSLASSLSAKACLCCGSSVQELEETCQLTYF